MNTGYQIYQAERPLSRSEQQQVDIARAELAQAVARCWHALTAPLSALRPAGRSAGRSSGRSSGRQPGHPARYQATEYQAECRPECLAGRAA